MTQFGKSTENITKGKPKEGEEAVLNLEEALDEWSLGSTVGALSNTSRLFDISLDAYGNKKNINNEVKNKINVLNKR